MSSNPSLRDSFGRTIEYVRVSVTDRCDLRCGYCLPERTAFLPKAAVLSLEELERLCALFISRGVSKIRVTGGEPLVRRDVMTFMRALSQRLHVGALRELTLTTNGARLAAFAGELAQIGVRRVNVSLDSLDHETFARITRRDCLPAVLEGIAAAQAAGLKVKLNVVVLKGVNERELPAIVQWAHARDMDVSLIEVMPVGEVDEPRCDQFLSLADVRRELESFWRLSDVPDRTGGPSRYVRIAETGGRLGFITPLSHNFCSDCNRVRLTCTGRLYLCLGQEDHVDFRLAMRQGASDDDLSAMLDGALSMKPKGHEFERAATHAGSVRHMATTGG